METTIYTFSGTGNSLLASRKLAEGLGTARVVSMAGIMRQGGLCCEAEAAGFVFPLYYLSFPKLVLEFLEQIDLSRTEYLFCMVTRGFAPMGGAIRHLKEVLSKRGKKLAAGFYLDMPSNDVILFDLESEACREEKLTRAWSRLDKIISIVSQRATSYDFEPLGFLRSLRHNHYLRRLKTAHLKFFVQEGCTGCGMCAKVCLKDNIRLVDESPFWGNACQECEACIHVCPKHLVQYDNKTQRKGRYRPIVGWNEIAAQKEG